jgi:DNA polymerase-3 subunit epsilon
MSARSWADGHLVSFDVESTGVSVEADRIVTACVVRIRPGQDPIVRTWLINPGIDIPAGATAVHGITTEQAVADGVDPAGAVREIAEALWRHGWSQDVPVIAYNAAFDLTMLVAELARYGAAEHLTPDMCLPVVDPLVLDKAVDRYRRGSRKLVDVCAHYGVRLAEDEAHTSDGDALAAARVAWCIARRYPEIGRADLGQLHDRQIGWAQQQADSLAQYWRRRARTAPAAEAAELLARADSVDGTWPVRPLTTPATQETHA